MKTTRIVNQFHGTETRVRAGLGEQVSLRTARRVQKALCGMEDCCCGDSAGARESYYTLVPNSIPGGGLAWEVSRTE